MNRRAALRTIGAGITIGVAGCSALESEGDVVEDELTLDPGTSDLSQSEFQSIVDNSHDTYGAGGIWGERASEPEHDLEYQGGWRTTLDHSEDVQSEHILALYRLPESPAGVESSQVWLWSGLDPADAGEVQCLTNGLELSSAAKLGIYSPAQDYNAADVDEYGIASGRLDVQTLETTMPLRSGTISVDPATQIGDGGAYYPRWDGNRSAAQSFAATTEIRWLEDSDRQFTWIVAAETTA